MFKPKDLFTIPGRGMVITGELSNEALTKGMSAKVGDAEVIIEEIETFREKHESVTASGDEVVNVGLLVSNVDESEIRQIIEQDEEILFR